MKEKRKVNQMMGEKEIKVEVVFDEEGEEIADYLDKLIEAHLELVKTANCRTNTVEC